MSVFISFQNRSIEKNLAVNLDRVAFVEDLRGYDKCTIIFSDGAKTIVDGNFQDVMTKLAGRSPTGGMW